MENLTAYKKNITLFIFLIIIYSCARIKKTQIHPSPAELLNKYKVVAPQKRCQSYELHGIIYFFSKKQNFRGKFHLMGNKWFPWIMEIKSPFGTTLFLIKIEKNIIKILSVRENKLYILNNSKEIFRYFGIKTKISPEFLLKLLTGDWKTFISSPKKIEQLPDGVKYFFNDQLVKEVKLYYYENRAHIWETQGVEVDIFDDEKIVLRDTNFAKMVFKIKRKICVKDKFHLKDLELKIPSNVTQELLIKEQTKTN